MELDTKDVLRQQNALMDVIVLANCSGSCNVRFHSIPDKMLRIENDLGVGSAVDLSGLVPDLVKIYRKARIDGNRFLALTALVDIGNERSLQSLVETPVEDHKELLRATNNRVAAFFFIRYPELVEQSLKRGTLSMDDVERARKARAKQDRKMSRKG